MSTIEQVQALIAASDKASREASAIVRPIHKEAMKAAQKLRDKLSASLMDSERKFKLLEIIEAGAAARKITPESAAAAITQYINVALKDSAMHIDQRMSGAYLAHTLVHYTNDWPESRRLIILDALLLGSKGQINAGLVDFPEHLLSSVSMEDAETLAQASNPESYQEYRSEIAKRVADHAQACRMYSAICDAKPELKATRITQCHMVDVMAHGGGVTLTACGEKIDFADDSVTKISFEQFGDLEHQAIFKSMRSNGKLEVVAMDCFAEPV